MPLISEMGMKSLIRSPLCSRWKQEYWRATGNSMMAWRTSWTCSWGETYCDNTQRLDIPRLITHVSLLTVISNFPGAWGSTMVRA